jgi:hypothetical protein
MARGGRHQPVDCCRRFPVFCVGHDCSSRLTGWVLQDLAIRADGPAGVLHLVHAANAPPGGRQRHLKNYLAATYFRQQPFLMRPGCQLGTGARTVYEITDAGRLEFRSWLRALEPG